MTIIDIDDIKLPLKQSDLGTPETNPLVDVVGNSSSNIPLSIIPDEPPPSFSPYNAEFFLDGQENVVSHDLHLNTDGEALYRFLLSQSRTPPTLRISFKGTHRETKDRWVSSTDASGHSTTRSETYTEDVTDFDFCIQVRPDHLRTSRENDEGYSPVHWSVGDEEPAYRGRVVRQTELGSPSYTSSPIGPERRKKATRKQVKDHLAWDQKRRLMGYPPWIKKEEELLYVQGRLSQENTGSLRSSMTLREWADEYCASPKYLKEFVYQKVLYGWNLQQLETSLRALIHSSPYSGDLKISFATCSSEIYIRPSNRLSRMLSKRWIKILLIIFLIYPFIWLFKRFSKVGGGTWKICGGAYPLKQWIPIGQEDTPSDLQIQRDEALPPYGPPNPILITVNPSIVSTSSSRGQQDSTRYMQTASGMKKLVGVMEGQWFKQWEGFIIRAVIGKYQSSEPVTQAWSVANELEGYTESTTLITF